MPGRNGWDRGWNITPLEREQTSAWSFFARESGKLLKEGKQMNAKACASSRVAPNWETIPWKTAESYVKKLQMRIAKAQQEGKHGKAQSLQWVLVHSFYAKALAVKQVTENAGKRTAGIDKVLWSTSKAKYAAVLSLKRHGYTAQPLRRVYIPKPNGKKRPLGIPTMRDRAMECRPHSTSKPVIEALVLGEIRRVAKFAQDREAEFIALVEKTHERITVNELRSARTERDKANHRITELDIIIKKLYEDICCKGRKSNPSNTVRAAGSYVAVRAAQPAGGRYIMRSCGSGACRSRFVFIGVFSFTAVQSRHSVPYLINANPIACKAFCRKNIPYAAVNMSTEAQHMVCFS